MKFSALGFLAIASIAALTACSAPGSLPIATPAAQTAAGSREQMSSIVCVTGVLDGSYPGACQGSGLNSPFDVAADAKGNVYIADSGNNAIKMVTPQGKISCITGTAGSGGVCTNSAFNAPGGVAVDARGDVYVADTGSARVFEVVAPLHKPWKVKQLASGFSFVLPERIAVDAKGNAYVADVDTRDVYEIAKGGAISCIAGVSSGCPRAAFGQPYGVAVDGAGNVYVADASNGTIDRISTKRKTSKVATGFASPGGVAVDSTCRAKCRVYVADTNDNEVAEFVPGAAVTVVAGPPSCGAGTCVFQSPGGVAVQYGCNSVACTVYVADTGNYSVKKVIR